jgi:predicted metalloprotease with PDZ domain
MLRTCAVAAAALLLLGAAPKPAYELVVSPQLGADGGYKALSVSFSFAGDGDGETAIELPDAWGGETKLYLSLQDVRIVGGEMSPGPKPNGYVVRHAPGAALRLSYTVIDGATGPARAIERGGNDYRPTIQREFFQALGNAIVPKVEGRSSDAPARFRLEGLPAGAQFASDLQHQDLGRALTYGDLFESVMLGGDIRVIDAGGGARLAIRGAIDGQDDAAWKGQLTRVATAQRAFWEAGEEPFLVTVLTSPPPQPGHVSVGGTGRSDAFAFFTTTNAPAETIVQVMSHEMMHSWIPRRIGKMSEGEDQKYQYWLSEGFTDWASFRTNVRGGLWAPEDFARAFNEKLKAYDLSPMRTAPNQAIFDGFWTSRAAQELPYQRGMLLATKWDHEIRIRTKGRKDLDDVLMRMQRMAKGKKGDLAVTLLPAAMKREAGIDIALDLAQLVDRGEAFEIPQDAFEPCGQLIWIDRALFDRGFDVEKTVAANMVVAGVNPQGPAYAAGLRDGMKILKRIGGAIGDSTVEIAYELEDQGAKRTLRWLPEGQGRERFRALQLTPNMGPEARAACAARLSGSN